MEFVPGMTDFNKSEAHHVMKSSNQKSEVRLMSLVQSITGTSGAKVSAPKVNKPSSDRVEPKAHYTQTRSDKISMASMTLDSLVTQPQREYSDGPD